MDVCRICLNAGKLTSVFEYDGAIKLADKIMAFASIRIIPDDNLPNYICSECIKRSNDSYSFKILCERSDLLLRKKLHNSDAGLDIKIENEQSAIKIEETDADETSEPKEKFHKANNDEITKDIAESNVINKTEVVRTACKKRQTRNKQKMTELDLNAEPYSPESSIDDRLSDLSSESDDSIDKISYKHKNKTIKACTIKKNKFNSRNSMKKSKNIKSNNKPHKEQCSVCGKIMSSKFRLKMHLRIHTGEKPFSCKHCDKKFALSQNLKVHERVHTGEKPLICGVCGKAFAQSAGLVTHTRLHTGETPYKCNLCPMSFRTPGHLQYHIRQHTGEKNYSCNICNRAFITRGDLTQHTKIHTGEKRYICTICGVRMSRSSHLTRHMMTHTGEKPHRCDICYSAYAQKGDLARHIKKHTNSNKIRECEKLGSKSDVKAEISKDSLKPTNFESNS